MRLRAAPAELALAIIMQDEELWAKGLWDLDYTLSMIEEEGYFVPLSAKGCKALGCLKRGQYVTILFKQTSTKVPGEFLGRLVLGEEDGSVKVFGATIF